MSQWANQERILSPESSAEPGKFYVERAEYQRGIMDAFSDPKIETVIVMSSSQIGKTEAINNICGYFIEQDPCPILIVQPTLEIAKSWSKDRLVPMLRDTPALKGKVRTPKAKASGQTILHKTFTGGHITIAGSNSPASLAARPVRVVLLDEVDRYEESAGTEGDPIDLAKKRATTFWNRKIGIFSTPTIKDQSRIELAYEMSDKRKYYVPCPHCNQYQVLRWKNLEWPEGQPKKAIYKCEQCKGEIRDSDKMKMLRVGEWRAEEEIGNIAGFWINELYSPWVTFGNMARRFMEAKKDKQTLRVFVNTSLGETWEDEAEKFEMDPVLARRENYEKIPMDAAVLVASVDVQDDRLEIIVKAYGEGKESWGIEHEIIYGNPGRAEVWKTLDQYLNKTWEHESGALLSLSITFIDSGYLARNVYEFTKPRSIRNVIATKGSNFPKHELVSAVSRKNKARCPLIFIGTNEAKNILFSRLIIQEKGPLYIHYNQKFDEEYFNQIYKSERPKWHKGCKIWEKISASSRNEALDLECLNLAAIERLRVNIPEKLASLKASAGPEKEEPKEQPIQDQFRTPGQPLNDPRRRRGGWVNNWKSR